MRSLFAKILLWFWATLVITVIGSALVSALSIGVSDRRFPLARLVSFELQEARYAYETGGREGLAAFMQRLHSVYRGGAYFTDRNGRDLLTGEDRSNLVRRAQRSESFAVLQRGGAMLTRAADDGRYWFFVMIPRARMGTWFLLPEHWWEMAIGVLLCYWLAFHLTTPVRQLERAVKRFGGGDLTARVNSKRHDELGRLARTFDEMAGRIENLLTAERRLLLDMSHELRSPLARLGVAVELARSGEDREAALNRIQKEADRLNSLVSGLLQVTRAECDPGTLRTERVRLDELLAELADDGALEAQARGCALKYHAAGSCAVNGDAELLRRAVENVMRNAIRYAPRDTEVLLTLECPLPLGRGSDPEPSRDRKGAVVRVRDFGPGVPKEALPRIFDAFYRVGSDRDRASGGAGLGLAIARRAVELHKGAMRARNAQPGLEIEIELPAIESKA